jgi:hypothetical protein
MDREQRELAFNEKLAAEVAQNQDAIADTHLINIIRFLYNI